MTTQVAVRTWDGFAPPPRTAVAMDAAEPLHCSFCGKRQDDVAFLIDNHPHCICSACVAVCAAMVLEAGLPLALKLKESK